MQWMSWFADIVGIIGGTFAFFTWIQVTRLRKDAEHERQRQNARIKVILSHGGEMYELPVPLKRSELTRSEVLGRIGMIPIKRDKDGKEQKRFVISYINSKEFFERLNELILGNGTDALIIPCKQDELEQFELKS